MSFDPNSRRFDPRWLLPAIETDGIEESGASDMSRIAADDESTNGPVGRDFDEALDQIASGGRCVCPLCGAIVESDGSVAN